MKGILFIAVLALSLWSCDTPEETTGSDTSTPTTTTTDTMNTMGNTSGDTTMMSGTDTTTARPDSLR